MKKVLLVGNGAREHVIAETLKKSGATVYIYGKARNPGLLELSEGYEVGDLKDFNYLKVFAKKVGPDFVFIGPDDPIADGVADLMLTVGLKSVGPLKSLARLESSKSFTRDLMNKYGIHGNPAYKVFVDMKGMEGFMNELGGNYVVKADGLMGGKGVKVSGDHLATIKDGLEYAEECIKAAAAIAGPSAGKVVIEEKFIGQEFSLMSFSDGKSTAVMPAVQDHKRAYDGDKGPNTGGMGSYSDANHLLPFLTQKDVEEAEVITNKVNEALLKETGLNYMGIMYGGFIATAKGTRLIEYNARFGDPEAMNVLPILRTNFVDVCLAILNQDLDRIKIEFEPKATVCKYIVPEGYPDSPKKGEKITIGQIPAGVKMYYASVDQTPDGLKTSSSRAIGLVGIGDSIEEAEKLAQSACDSIKGPVFYRKDVGTKSLIDQRVEMMKKLRG